MTDVPEPQELAERGRERREAARERATAERRHAAEELGEDDGTADEH